MGLGMETNNAKNGEVTASENLFAGTKMILLSSMNIEP